ncbi:unnamed protein product [Rotaria magnacalcarata]|uniref:Uncharacterized protein n=2 Tax=Rotaria magnacalcarata TaxID=392030 RepID=A0A816RKU6_9BILA|nr:unnamed protein product [Rotaria magnacalcarata]CAF2071558.1 unnamed protein product [Rotaria magnacalcarata]CAF4127714.1 unnamed protein product [Rotaria magnacalcarata]CAF4254701.1 unnamed protein product [Rotaria magnacalcarata]
MIHWQLFLVFLVGRTIAQQSLNINNFVPFGSAVGDKTLERRIDFVTGPIPIKFRFPFFNQWHDEIKLWSHGLILFGNITYNLPHTPPGPFPLRNFICAAPYWADTDIAQDLQSDIFYREVDDVETLSQITSMVRNGFPQFTTYRMLWAFVATWYRVPGHQSSPGRNTFQAIITTNGFYSFTIFTYHQLQWSAGLWGGYPQIGFNAGDQVNYFTLEKSFSPDVVEVVNDSNIGVPGQFVFHTTGNISDVECNSVEGLQSMPFRGSMYGGYEFRLSGICFNQSDYTVEIDGQQIVNCQIAPSYISCMMPMTYGGRLKIRLYSERRPIGETDFLAIEPEHNAHLILHNYHELDDSVQQTDNDQFALQFQSNAITNNYLFHVVVYYYGAQMWLNNGTIHNRTHSRIDLGLGPRNLSLLQNLTIRYESIFSIIDQPVDRTHLLTIAFEVVRPSSRIVWAAVPLILLRIIVVAAVTFESYCPLWHAFEPNPQIYINQIPPCPCRVLTTWSENQLGFTADGACDGRYPLGKNCMFHQGASGCYRRKSNTGNAGAQCCYNSQGAWISNWENGAGTLDAYSPDGSLLSLGHIFSDVIPYFSCCKSILSPSKERCKQYMNKRPPGRCENLLPLPAGGNGDPHFTTLNGGSYTFNGYGEYTLIKSTVAQFEVQVRLAPVNANSPSPSSDNATAIVAFVIRNGNQSLVQFEMFRIQKMIEIRVNGRTIEYTPLTTENIEFFTTSQLIYSDDHQLNIRQTSLTSFEISYGETSMQFIVNARSAFDFLDLLFILPRDLMKNGQPRGLMGDLDGLVYENGTRVLSATMTNDQSLFEYGESWRTTSATSLFYYNSPNSYATYQNTKYRPAFHQTLLQKYNGTSRFTMAQQSCQNLKDSQRCVYDVLITNDPTLSLMHKQFDTNMVTWESYIKQVEEDIANQPSKATTNTISKLLIGWACAHLFFIFH